MSAVYDDPHWGQQCPRPGPAFMQVSGSWREGFTDPYEMNLKGVRQEYLGGGGERIRVPVEGTTRAKKGAPLDEV